MTRLAILSATALSLAACHFSGRAEDRDVGAETSRTYDVASFDEIEVAGPYDVTVTTGGATAVAAKGGSALLDETEVVVQDNKLLIRPKKKHGFRFGWKGGKAAFTVSTAALNGATIAGSGDINVDKAGGDFRGNVAGSGSLKLATLTAGAAEMAIAGSGGIRAAGTAQSIKVSIAGSGDVDAGGLAAKSADISIAGSGNVRANASDTADISIMGSGDVTVSGGAKCTTSKMGSGSVNCS
jgi:hypothetical protein